MSRNHNLRRTCRRLIDHQEYKDHRTTLARRSLVGCFLPRPQETNNAMLLCPMGHRFPTILMEQVLGRTRLQRKMRRIKEAKLEARVEKLVALLQSTSHLSRKNLRLVSQ